MRTADNPFVLFFWGRYCVFADKKCDIPRIYCQSFYKKRDKKEKGYVQFYYFCNWIEVTPSRTYEKRRSVMLIL